MSGATVVTSETVSDAVSRMGLAGHAVMVHSSLNSFGWVESGAQTVIDGILGQECTIMVPTFSRAYELLPRQDERIPRNGKEYEGGLELPPGSDPIYAPDSNVVNPSMGTIPATLLAMSGRVRSVHARQSFTAVGPLAEELAADQTVEDVFAPIRNLGRMQGFVVLMGVGLTKMTALHFAEEMAGRRPFRRWATGPMGAAGHSQSPAARTASITWLRCCHRLSDTPWWAGASGGYSPPPRPWSGHRRPSGQSNRLPVATRKSAWTARMPSRVAR